MDISNLHTRHFRQIYFKLNIAHNNMATEICIDNISTGAELVNTNMEHTELVVNKHI